MSDQKRSTISPSRLPKLFFLVIMFLVLFILSGCDPWCAAQIGAHAWNDSNRDGIKDPGEQPLENVAVDYSRGGFGEDSTPYFVGTDRKGRATLLEPSLGSCPRYVSGKVRPLDGYTLTTPDVFMITLSSTTTETVSLDFGFAYNLQAMPTPKPTGRIECYSIPAWADGQLSDIEFMPNDDVWVAGMDRRYQWMIMLKQADKDLYPVEMAGAFSPHDLAQAPDQTLWVAAFGVDGVAHYDGETWQYHTPENGLPFDNVHTVKVAPNGHVWIAGETVAVGRLAEFDPSSGIWQERAEIGTGNSLEQSDNGDLWLINSHPFSLTRFSYSDPSGSARKIEFTDLNTDVFWANGTALAKDDSLWVDGHLINGEPVLMRYRSTTEKWTIFTYSSTLGAMPADKLIGLTALPDGSVFLRTFRGDRYRYVPDSTDSPTGGQWIIFPGVSQAQNPSVTGTKDFPSTADGLILTENKLCKVK